MFLPISKSHTLKSVDHRLKLPTGIAFTKQQNEQKQNCIWLIAVPNDDEDHDDDDHNNIFVCASVPIHIFNFNRLIRWISSAAESKRALYFICYSIALPSQGLIGIISILIEFAIFVLLLLSLCVASIV